MIYLTGDTHGAMDRVRIFCEIHALAKDDLVVILGDVGLNYSGPSSTQDHGSKEILAECRPTFFCIHGNHEMRPSTIETYRETEYRGGIVYVEDQYPNILFAKDGEVYNFDSKKVMAIGGAYSIDKEFRLARGYRWFDDEQPSEEIKARVKKTLTKNNWCVDVVLSHTCPKKYIPTEVFLAGVDQRKVDSTTEEWLDAIEDRLEYEQWFCGHYHTNKRVDKITILFEDWEVLSPADSVFDAEA